LARAVVARRAKPSVLELPAEGRVVLLGWLCYQEATAATHCPCL
jgi:hypothetical protein